jgi:hypothetical protein
MQVKLIAVAHQLCGLRICSELNVQLRQEDKK